MDRELFFAACNEIIGVERKENGIGTLSERSLHAILKRYYEPDISHHEVKVGRFVADISNESGIVEIQTRSFNVMRSKLEYFLSLGKVTVVYPIAKLKWLCWIDTETGEISKKRKSPKVGTVYDSFFELYKIKQFLSNKNLEICLVMLEVTEYRSLNGWSVDKKKGSSREERVPNDIIDEVTVGGEFGYAALIPDCLKNGFNAKDFAKAARLSVSRAQTALNVLTYVGSVVRVGKVGNAFIYDRV